jgi:Amt family ammonium transporter
MHVYRQESHNDRWAAAASRFVVGRPNTRIGKGTFMNGMKTFKLASSVGLIVAFSAAMAAAQDAEPAMATSVALDTLWVLLAGGLVFFMNTGFGMLESGLCRSKNTVNVLAKNFIVFALASLSFYILGWGLMFGDGSGFMGTHGLFMLSGADNSPAMGDAYQGVYGSINWTGVPLLAKFFFQLVFAATAATIVSGAVAERIKFMAYMILAFVLVGVMYPITGHWIWGGGWLAGLGFWDFAGSTVVHSVGGWAALAGALLLGPRIGKYTKDGKVSPIPGHNMSSAFAGCFILWLGWFGFNPGSTMGMADTDLVARIFVTTNMAAAAGAFSATVVAWVKLGKPDFSMILNGCLAGLVAITAPCAWVSVPASIVIGLVAGALVVFAVLFFDSVRVDDPVGAISVHLVNGVWGTLAVGLFAHPEFGASLLENGRGALIVAQLIGIAAVGVFTFAVSIAVWLAIKATYGLRVSPEEEMEGLDYGEHGMQAYPDFQQSAVGSGLATGGYGGSGKSVVGTTSYATALKAETA